MTLITSDAQISSAQASVHPGGRPPWAADNESNKNKIEQHP